MICSENLRGYASLKTCRHSKLPSLKSGLTQFLVQNVRNVLKGLKRHFLWLLWFLFFKKCSILYSNFLENWPNYYHNKWSDYWGLLRFFSRHRSKYVSENSKKMEKKIAKKNVIKFRSKGKFGKKQFQKCLVLGELHLPKLPVRVGLCFSHSEGSASRLRTLLDWILIANWLPSNIG